MPVTITATPGSATANSYVTAQEATDYVAVHYLSAAILATWAAATTDTKAQALIQATQALDRLVQWEGYVVSSSVQSLAWPRANAFDRYDRAIGLAVVPTFLKEFTIEVALWLVNQAAVVPQASGTQFSEVKVEGIDIKFADGVGEAPLTFLPSTVLASLAPMGTYIAQMPRGPRAVPLVRV